MGNLKTTIAGTLKSVAKRYVFRHLAEFQYRFNRRLDLLAMLDRLTGALLDRLTQHVHVLAMNGNSYRLAHSKRRSLRTNVDPPPDEWTQD